MRGFTVDYYKTLTEAIGRTEEKTSAEVVVVVEPWSGGYRDVDLAVGAAAALAALAAILYGPWLQSEVATLADVALVFALGAWISSAVPAVRRALTRPARREKQVGEAAAASFYQENVWTTRSRTGLLIYVSLTEREALALADRGVTGAVAPTVWNDWLAKLREVPSASDPPRALLAALDGLGEALASALPPEADNPDELPNLPRRRH
jgi:putative membrane protein